MTGRRAPGSLVSRLLLSQLAVSLTMALTMILVAVIAGPPVFEDHMREAGHGTPAVLAHSVEAFNAAGLLALGLGLVIATTGATLVSFVTARRLRRPLTDLGAAASRISEGDYELHLEAADARELVSLADSFNTMAGRLAATEASRRRLLTDLAHEIRTPLASMEVCVESLEDGAIDPGPQAWQILSDQLHRISRLADDLGAVSAAEEGRLDLSPTRVDLGGVVAGAVLAAREAYQRKGVTLRFAEDGPAVPAIADRARLQQVLGNLLSNALRHTPASGRVDVELADEGPRVAVRITDTGDGIAAEHLPHLFERFYRVDTARDRSSGGTGVGLTISRAIARAHGGGLDASSPGPGRGSTFTLWLPTQAAEPSSNQH